MTELIPEEANRYWPSGDKLFVGSGKSIVRFIFYQTDYTDFELQMISDFKVYLANNGVISLPTSYGDEELLRTLIGCKFKFKNASEAINASIEWKSRNVPFGYHSLLPKVLSLVNSGTIYLHGRDHRYRPLIVLNAGKLDFTANTIEDYCNLLCFILEYTVTCLMMSGHIENWVVITDLNGQSLHNLPISQLKVIIKTLQDNYRCRMIVNYVVNAPKTLKFLWMVLKNFVEPHTVNKIRILREGKPQEMRNHFAANQYEEKYGGKAPNATQFWPPNLPTGPFEAEHEKIGSHLIDPYKSAEFTTKQPVNEEVFFSVAEEPHEDYFSVISDLSSFSRNTVYLDCFPNDESTSKSQYLTINSSISERSCESSILPKEKKCCEKCSLF